MNNNIYLKIIIIFIPFQIVTIDIRIVIRIIRAILVVGMAKRTIVVFTRRRFTPFRNGIGMRR
jgi:hypothetical protein